MVAVTIMHGVGSTMW